MDIANNVWHIAPVPPDYIDHPAPFPEEIPFRLITLYSYPNDLVLDPFAGSGQTLKVARWLNRQYVGYEIIEKYVDLCRRRVNEPLSLRPQQLVAVFEKIDLEEPVISKRKKSLEKQEQENNEQLYLFESKGIYETPNR